MRMLQAHRHSRRHDSSAHQYDRSISLSAQDEADQMTGRHEPEILTLRALPQDPYAVWLEQREADREREGHPPVRWIHRQPGVGRPTIRASAVGDPSVRPVRTSSDRASATMTGG